MRLVHHAAFADARRAALQIPTLAPLLDSIAFYTCPPSNPHHHRPSHHSAAPVSGTAFSLPRFYDYPPYFTLQPVKATRERQVRLWAELIVAWCRHHRTLLVSLDHFPLFHNASIQRKLTFEARQVFLEALVAEGRAEWTDRSRTRCLVLWKSINDWADTLLHFVRENGFGDSVLTLEEIRAGDDTKGTDLEGIDEDVLRRAIRVLEGRGLATLFKGSSSDDEGHALQLTHAAAESLRRNTGLRNPKERSPRRELAVSRVCFLQSAASGGTPGSVLEGMAAERVMGVLVDAVKEAVLAAVREELGAHKEGVDEVRRMLAAVGEGSDATAAVGKERERELAAVKGVLEAMKGGLAAVKWEVAAVKGGFAAMKGEVASVKGEFAAVKGEFAAVKGEFAAVKGEFAAVKGEVAAVKGELVAVKVELAEHKEQWAEGSRASYVWGMRGESRKRSHEMTAELAWEEESSREVQERPEGYMGASPVSNLDLGNHHGLSDAMLGHVSTMTHLTSIDLEDSSGFSAEGIKHLYRLPRLEMLNLNGTDISDSALEGIGSLTRLKQLYLWQTNVTNAALLHFTALSSLKELDLSHCNGVSAAGVVHLGRLTRLEKLWLYETAVTDTGLLHLTALSSLKELDLSRCKGVSAVGMVHVRRLTGLEELWIHETAVTDTGLQQLTGLSSLKVLSISNCKGVTNAGMVHVGRLTGLERLNLDHSSVTDDGLQQLTSLTKLTSLYTPEDALLVNDDVRTRIGW
ncbi:unnamed protein product [Closterium sp. Yama58-4]|nr:unnamed protein product [Closterium sp. Yama58-4]